MITNSDIINYYNTTQNHYERWWNLKGTLALHYGIWNTNTHKFSQALINTNKTLMNYANISANDKVLDAGCGIGGSSLYIAKTTQAKVFGISLSEKQIAQAQISAELKGLAKITEFGVMDYTKTKFTDESFDVIWAIESVCHANSKQDFINEAYRLLKKGGRLIMSDFFLNEQNQIDKKQLIKKWCDTWSVPNLVSGKLFEDYLNKSGFKNSQLFDYTEDITKSAKRMYLASLLGAMPSELYNITHPKVTQFAKNHYKCGYYQYKALKANLWRYNIILAIK